MLNIFFDKRLIDLISRIKQAESCYYPNVVILVGYDRLREDVQRVPEFFSNSDEFYKRFTEKERAKFNGRVVSHVFGSGEYRCMTDIPDHVSSKYEGKWLLVGDVEGKRSAHVFPTRAALLDKRKDLLSRMEGMAIEHEVGTRDYVLVDTRCYRVIEDLTEDKLLEEVKTH